MSTVETSTPPQTPTPIGPYSHVAKVGSWITIGGVAGVDPATMRPRVAKGVIAIGNIAVGVFALGGLSFGLITACGSSTADTVIPRHSSFCGGGSAS